MMSKVDFTDRVAFAVGTGRSGTHFIARVLAYEPGVASSHERNPMNEAFHRYCQWYNLPVDQEGFLHVKEDAICQDLAGKHLSFEASAYLSLSICKLYERFDAKFILLLRRPDQVVNSLWSKSWYEQPYVQSDTNKALGYQQNLKDHHFFSRIAPVGTEFEPWNGMSRVGKLGWFWNLINLRVVEQFAMIPKTHWRVIKLEELSYTTYLGLGEFLGIKPQIKEEEYVRLASSRPGNRPWMHTPANWSEREIAEFEIQVSPAAKHFDYEYRVNALPLAEPLNTQDRMSPMATLLHKVHKKLDRRATSRP